MRRSLLLVLGLAPSVGCSVLLDWDDYTGGLDAGVDVVAPIEDAGTPSPEASTDATTVELHDAEASTPVEAAPPEETSTAPTCDIASCPTQVCRITVEFQPCCLPEGGCGCQATIPSVGPCM
jgi:hypothetical protein